MTSQEAVASKGLYVLLPPQQFYWAVVDASQVAKASGSQPRNPRNPRTLRNFRNFRGHRQLGYLFENVLPVPIEDVQAVYVRLPGGSYLACGMDKNLLQAQCNGHLHLGPDQVPPDICDSVPAERINLLACEFEPKVVQRLKVRWLLRTAAMLLLAAMVIGIGLHRRTVVNQRSLAALDNSRQQLFQVAGIDPAGSQPPELKLTAELRRLRQTRLAPTGDMELTDVTTLLAALLSHWPPDEAHMQTEFLSVTPTAITVRGLVPASDGAQVVASSINAAHDESLFQVEGQGRFRLREQVWTMAQPQVTNVRDGVQVVLQMSAKATEGQP
jgi:hypothetical protein